MQKSNVFRGLMACTAMIAVSESALASDWGSFNGVTIEAKLIGGQQYEGLYGRIAEWEEDLSGSSCTFQSFFKHR